MQVKDVMTRTVNVISPDATLKEAATKMKHFDVGSLPVCDGGRLVGMITDRDIVVRALADDAHSLEAKVVSVMTPSVVFCYENQEVDTVTELMGSKQVRRVLVFDRIKRLVGIVSLGDLAIKGNRREKVAEALEQIVGPIPFPPTLEAA